MTGEHPRAAWRYPGGTPGANFNFKLVRYAPTLERSKYFMRACPAKAGDHLEFLAEIDLPCARSTRPGGDLSVPLRGADARNPLEACRPLGVEVSAIDTILNEGWKQPEVAAYGGGFVDRDGTIKQAVAREVMEETGYEVADISLFRIIDTPDRPGEDRQNIVFVHLCAAGQRIRSLR